MHVLAGIKTHRLVEAKTDPGGLSEHRRESAKAVSDKLMPMNHENVANVNTFGIKCLIMDLL